MYCDVIAHDLLEGQSKRLCYSVRLAGLASSEWWVTERQDISMLNRTEQGMHHMMHGA